MTDPDYQAFLAWKASQAAAAAASTHDEAPPPTIADVLKALVRSARLPDERTVDVFSQVIDDHFAEAEDNPADTSAPDETSVPAPAAPVPSITFASAGENGGTA